MCDLFLQVGWQIDDVDRIEGTLLGTDTATNAESFRDEGNLAFWRDLDTELTGLDDRTTLLAFLSAFLRLALVAVDDSDTDTRLACRPHPTKLGLPSQFVTHPGSLCLGLMWSVGCPVLLPG